MIILSRRFISSRYVTFFSEAYLGWVLKPMAQKFLLIAIFFFVLQYCVCIGHILELKSELDF